MTIVPGAYDAIGARLIEQAGYAACYMTGAGVALSRGYPDLGLLTMTEMVDSARTMARSVAIPLIADADTGFGNELNVTRCVREYEAAGVAAIHIEDQVMPKRCGHLAGKEVVSRQEFLAKIRAALAARSNKKLKVIARTDARAVHGFDDAIWRANSALDAGADMAFVEATQSVEEAASVPRLVGGPCVLNIVPGGLTPISNLAEANDMGYRLAILPAHLFLAKTGAAEASLLELRNTNLVRPSSQSISQLFRKFGLDEWEVLRSKFLDEGVRSEEKEHDA
jgi:2-methylisocitrate lyase-like PEP mutase family enzyme